MIFLPIKKNRLKLVKEDRVSIHETTSKCRKFVCDKIYLNDNEDIDSRFQLFEV